MSTSSVRRDPAAVRADAAAEWLLKMQEDATEEDLRQWIEWCAADPENLREYERIRDTWQGVAQVEAEAQELLAAASASDLAARGPVGARLREASPHPLAASGAIAVRTPWLRHRLAAAATVAAVALGGGVYFAGNVSANKQVLTARPADNTSATLPDGSTLTLAPRTNVAMDFSGAARRLNLSMGEAYFKVSPDRSKPFVVQAEGLKVVAIGTAFGVKSEPRNVEVTVEEGLVEASNGAQTWRVGAGYRIAYDIDSGAARLAAIDAVRELAWREGRLEYFMQPLSAVVNDVNRYSNKRIEIADPQVAQLAYTGTIFTASIEDWLSAVQSTFPVQTEQTASRVVLRARAAQ